jgi:hypothetical protein
VGDVAVMKRPHKIQVGDVAAMNSLKSPEKSEVKQLFKKRNLFFINYGYPYPLLGKELGSCSGDEMMEVICIADRGRTGLVEGKSSREVL